MTLYTDLGVEPTADAATIKRAHRKAARQHHPDAGGNRDDFERIQRAALVLCDPARRARYDETGETEAAPDNSMAEITLVILQAFDAAMNEIGDRFEQVDMVAMTKAKMKQGLAAMEKSARDHEALGKKLERARKRLTFKGGSIDFIGNVLLERIAGNARAVEQIGQQIERVKTAMGHLDAYGWEVVQPSFSDFDRHVMNQVHMSVYGNGTFRATNGI